MSENYPCKSPFHNWIILLVFMFQLFLQQSWRWLWFKTVFYNNPLSYHLLLQFLQKERKGTDI